MTKEYYLRPGETNEAFDGDWFKTGDIGKMENGHLIFVREKKKTRKIKGNMVDLEEVRRALMTYPKIRNARIECSNNLLSAGISIDSITNFDEEVLEIKKHLEAMIARYKIPKEISRI
jgi:feruloyl-CoA synthase